MGVDRGVWHLMVGQPYPVRLAFGLRAPKERVRGREVAGQTVPVIGASGGVGTFTVQIAKAFGAGVTGVCRTSKVDLVRSLGADHVLDHTRDRSSRRSSAPAG